MRVRELLARTTAQLKAAGIPVPALEAEVLLRHVMGAERAAFFASLEHQLTPSQADQLTQLVARRLEREPLAYIVGHREFYGLDFVVNPYVLIPRQETELVVETALRLAARRPGERLEIADVGTGSGAIAIAIAHSLPHATLYATDISCEALAVAALNARRLGVSERVHLCQGDLLDALPGPVDMIVSNPPYVRTSEVAQLAPEVGREPVRALDGGADGLEVVRRLLRQSPAHLRPGGCVIVEIAPEQLAHVSEQARAAFPGAEVSFERDLSGLPRVVIIETAGFPAQSAG